MLEKHSKSTTKHIASEVIITETPFEQRHCCWFCGEPSHLAFIFPPQSSTQSYHRAEHIVLDCPHPSLSVPCCAECKKIACKAEGGHIWAVRDLVKKSLLKRYAKDLAIGVNWTPDELANSDFEGGNFAGFAKSAWFIYEVAKGRVSYSGWPLVVKGIDLDIAHHEEEVPFTFDGVKFPSLNEAIEHYSSAFKLDAHYVTAVLQQMSNGNTDRQSFARTIRYCRLLVGSTPEERKLAFAQLVR